MWKVGDTVTASKTMTDFWTELRGRTGTVIKVGYRTLDLRFDGIVKAHRGASSELYEPVDSVERPRRRFTACGEIRDVAADCRAEILALRADGVAVAQIAKDHGVSRQRIYQIIGS
jgi:hypothetical protein